MSRVWMVALGGFVLTALMLRADEPEALPEPLQKARKTYTDDVGAIRKEVAAHLDELTAAARKKGDTDVVMRLIAEADAFQKEGAFPKSIPGAERVRYLSGLYRAQIKAIAAFDEVSKELTKNAKDGEAEKIEVEKRRFAKTLEPTLTPLVLKGASYRLFVRKSGLAVVPSDSSKETGAGIIQWKLQEDNDAMHWQLTADGDTYAFVNKKSGKALTIKGASLANGALIVQAPLGKGNASQQWKLMGTEPGWFKVISKYSGRALSVHAGSIDPGVHLLQWPDGARADHGQQYQLRLVD